MKLRPAAAVLAGGVLLVAALLWWGLGRDTAMTDFGASLGSAFASRSPAALAPLLAPANRADTGKLAEAIKNVAGAAETPTDVTVAPGPDATSATVRFKLAGSNRTLPATKVAGTWKAIVQPVLVPAPGYGWAFDAKVKPDQATGAQLLVGVYKITGTAPDWFTPSATEVTVLGTPGATPPAALTWKATEKFVEKSRPVALALFQGCLKPGAPPVGPTDAKPCGLDVAVSSVPQSFTITPARQAQQAQPAGAPSGPPSRLWWQTEPLTAGVSAQIQGVPTAASIYSVRLLVTTELPDACLAGAWSATCEPVAVPRTGSFGQPVGPVASMLATGP